MLRWWAEPTLVTLRNYYRTSIGATVMARTEAVRASGGYDEQIGPGAGTPYGSCEDADASMRLVARGPVAYHPELTVHHDDVQVTLEANLAEKMRGYWGGQAWFWRWRHDYPYWHRAWFLGRKTVRSCCTPCGVAWRRRGPHRAFVRGRRRGWFRPAGAGAG